MSVSSTSPRWSVDYHGSVIEVVVPPHGLHQDVECWYKYGFDGVLLFYDYVSS